MRIGTLLVRLGLSLVATALVLLLLEGAIRLYDASGRRMSPSLHVLLDSPVLYGLNTRHPEISSQGLRDDEVVMPKPPGALRILVLGDSITYGPRVGRSETFCSRLERLLSAEHGPVDVINAGVTGYSPFNELEYYRAQGREFQPDIVMVAFCMNDVANPRLHWRLARKPIKNIPAAAIPNRDDDEQRVQPLVERRRRSRSLLDRSRLISAARYRMRILRAEREVRGQAAHEIPTFITGEDTLGIGVLLDAASPEWVWLRSMYDQLRATVEQDGATFILLVFPMAYQLDESYPYFPQQVFADYCARRGMACVDLLEPFRSHGADDLFLVGDPWHLTANGHEVTAAAVRRYLEEHVLGAPARRL